MLLLSVILINTSCTKKRSPTLPESEKEYIFAISEFGPLVDKNSQYSITTGNRIENNNPQSQALAINEVGKVNIRGSNVPDRLKLMLEQLQISGKPKTKYEITFAIDRQFITAYKIIQDVSELSTIEKQLSKTKAMIQAGLSLQTKITDTDRSKVIQQLEQAKTDREKIITGQNKGILLVPLFKYKIEAFGRLKNSKTELDEETSSLSLYQTDQQQATHLSLNPLTSARLEIGLTSESMDQVERLFLKNKLNGLLMTAGDFTKIYLVELNMKPEVLIYTQVFKNNLYIYRLVDKKDESVTSDLKDSVKNKGTNLVYPCNDKINQKYSQQFKNGCLMIGSQVLEIKQVNIQLPKIDASGNESNHLVIGALPNTIDSPMVYIEKYAATTILRSDMQNVYNNAIPLNQLTGKEFFFRRTIEDVPMYLRYIEAGSPSDVIIVRFVPRKDRIVVLKADRFIQPGNKPTAIDDQEIMSLPVTYLKKPVSSFVGQKSNTEQLVEATQEDAEFVTINWTQNQLPRLNSPIDDFGFGHCLTQISNETTSDIDNRLSNGILNLSINYTSSLSPACAEQLSNPEFNEFSRSNESRALSVQIKERISFRINDGKTDKSFVPQVPYKIKRALGYGNWTNNVYRPGDKNYNPEDDDTKYYSVVSDFREGRMMKYTVIGLPEDSHRRQLLIDAIDQVIKDWNLALKTAFEDTDLKRKTDYISYEIANENSEHKVHLGDLDKNFIYINNNATSSETIGFSRTGVNPRSGVNIADLVVLYQRNLEKVVKENITKIVHVREYKAKLTVTEINLNKVEEARKQMEKPLGYWGLDESVFTAEEKTKVNTKDDLKDFTLTRNFQEKFDDLSNYENLNNRREQISSKIQNNYKWVEYAYDIINQNNGEITDDQKADIYEYFLKERNKDLSDFDRNKIKAEINSLRSDAAVYNRQAAHLNCRLSYGATNNIDDITMEDFDQLYTREMKYTIAHEMGHSLGLTHNFKGSAYESILYGEKEYSSVMDYFPIFDIKYKGLGDQDIFSIRAIYSGLIEAFNDPKNKEEEYWNPMIAHSELLIKKNYINVSNILQILTKITKEDEELNISDIDNIIMKEFALHYRTCSDNELIQQVYLDCQKYDTSGKESPQTKNLNELESIYFTDFINLGNKILTDFNMIQSSLKMFQKITKTFNLCTLQLFSRKCFDPKNLIQYIIYPRNKNFNYISKVKYGYLDDKEIYLKYKYLRKIGYREPLIESGFETFDRYATLNFNQVSLYTLLLFTKFGIKNHNIRNYSIEKNNESTDNPKIGTSGLLITSLFLDDAIMLTNWRPIEGEVDIVNRYMIEKPSYLNRETKKIMTEYALTNFYNSKFEFHNNIAKQLMVKIKPNSSEYDLDRYQPL